MTRGSGGAVTEPAAAAGPSAPSWVREAWRFGRDAFRSLVEDFLAGTLRAGSIRLRGRVPAVQAVIVTTGALLALTFVSFASGDLFRTGQDLLAMPGGRAGRGTLLPAWLPSFTFLLIAVGIALLLAGALHAPPAVRLGALGLGVLVLMTVLATADAAKDLSGTVVGPGWVALAAVPVVFALRWRAPARPGPEFVVLLLLVAAVLGVADHGLASADAYVGDGFAAGQAGLIVVQLAAIASPLVFVAGLDVIAFGLDASSWSLRFIDRRVGPTVVIGAVVALGLWRTRDTLDRLAGEVGDVGLVDTLLPLLGAAVLVGAIAAWWAAVRWLAGWGPGQRAGEDSVEHSSTQIRLWLAGAFSLTLLLPVPVVLLSQVLVLMDWAGPDLLARLSDIIELLDRSWVATANRLLVGAALVALGAAEARRGRPPTALFLGTIGLSALLGQLFVTGPLDALHWSGPEAVDTVWLAVTLGLTGWWLAGRRFTDTRSARVLFVLVLGALVAQFDVVTDPFRPLLGFTGVGFVVFGLAWGFLTGGAATNASTPEFGRSARAYLYLGYSLLSVALLHWTTVAHDLDLEEGLAQTGADGVVVLGYPLVYAVFALMVAGAVADRPVDELVGPDEGPAAPTAP